MTYGGVVTSVTLLPVGLLPGEDPLATTLYGWAMLVALADPPTAFSSVALLLQPVAAAHLAWAKPSGGIKRRAAPSCWPA